LGRAQVRANDGARCGTMIRDARPRERARATDATRDSARDG
jgi:hypothetical protein